MERIDDNFALISQPEETGTKQSIDRLLEDAYTPARPAPKDPLYPGPSPFPKPSPRPPRPFKPEEFETPKLDLDSIQKFLDSLKEQKEHAIPPKKDRIADDADKVEFESKNKPEKK